MASNHALLVGAVLIVAMAANVQGVCKQLDCPQENGYFAHPRSCVAYVKCLEGKAFLEKCPANLHYNPGTGMCDLPENTQCVEEVKLRSTSCKLTPPPRLRTAPVPGIECDCGKCCRKPNPLDCTSFYECDENGNAFSKSCSAGLVYNPVKEDCDLDTNYECPVIPSCSCKCRYPVDNECDAFYRCEEVGKPVNKEYCSEGLIFNSETEMCDLPDNVECPAGPAPTEATGECKDLKSDCKYWVANGDCICDEFKSGDCSWQHYVQNNCPNTCKLKGCSGSPNPPVTEGGSNGGVIEGCVIDCVLGQYYRHPFDCAKFIQCAPYGPQEMPCAAGTRWDQDLLTCNHASQTKCVTGQYKDVEGKDCGGDVIDVVPTSPPPTPAPVPTEPPVNPPTIDGCVINCQLGQYYRHPFDCAKFIQCAPYGPQEMPCAAGTRWDQDLLTCNHASQTKCVTGQYKDVEGKDCGGDVIDVVPTNPPPTPAPVPTEPPVNPPTIDGCVINCQLGQYYRHPSDCTKFIQCAPYGPQEMPCGAGTRWDQDILTCNHASSTDCVTGTYLDKDGNNCGGEPEQPGSPDCEIDCSKGQYHRHPTDCTKFIQCAPYGPQEMPCGAGTRWDQNLLTCNHASVTKCVTGNGDCVATITESPPPACDIQCPQVNGEFAHPRDCKKWVHCSNNIAHIKDCPSSLLFDPTKKVCNWPHETVCISTLESDCVVPIIPTPTTSTPIVPPEVCDCECCLRPHPEDCQSYYYCDGTNTEFHTCSDGLVFHPENETCVFAADYPQCNLIVPPECECECLYPSPICSEYFKCVDKKPERKECPTGLHFNHDTHACDLPANVDCTTTPSKRSGFGRLVPAIGAEGCANLPDGRYANRANPDDFYHCARGVAFLLRCQAGGTFSQRTGRCERK